MRNIAVGEGSLYGCGSPLVHVQFFSMSHDLSLPALIRSEGESLKMTEKEKKSLLTHSLVTVSLEGAGWVVEGCEQRLDLIPGPGD